MALKLFSIYLSIYLTRQSNIQLLSFSWSFLFVCLVQVYFFWSIVIARFIDSTSWYLFISSPSRHHSRNHNLFLRILCLNSLKIHFGFYRTGSFERHPIVWLNLSDPIVSITQMSLYALNTPEPNFTGSGPADITFKCTVRGNPNLTSAFGKAIDPSTYDEVSFSFFSRLPQSD